MLERQKGGTLQGLAGHRKGLDSTKNSGRPLKCGEHRDLDKEKPLLFLYYR